MPLQPFEGVLVLERDDPDRIMVIGPWLYEYF